MIKVLVQYHLIPESVETAIVDLSQEDFDFLKQANGVYINAEVYTPEQEKACCAISEAFSTDPESKVYAEKEGLGDWFMRFSGKTVNTNEPNNPLSLKDVDYIINAGFIL